ncbi:GAF domain-containing protein [Nocardia sp. AG03]|uniref:GAF domain-containing protein n=1 Tax=Nocardia sp. AG03 TaxID=3025312 RepID=UPI0024189EB9|nr:GAF domain-containing protein [Nocardia sp. AG03]
MIIGRWQLVETLGAPENWSMLTAGTTPREWTSYQRAIPTRLQPLVATAHASGERIERTLPRSRNPWSELLFRADPVCWADAGVHGVRVWVGQRAPEQDLGAAPFQVDARTRVVRTMPSGLGPHFGATPVEYTGAEQFQRIDRFDGALDVVAALTRSEPGSRWSAVATVRSGSGPRSLLLAARNSDTDRFAWRGLAVDVTDSVVPQPKSFEAATLELLRDTQPGLYLVILDTAQVRMVRWVTEPVPGLRWRGTDERTVPHPDDRVRITAARAEIMAGATRAALPALRLAAENGGWLTADVEVSPLPGSDVVPAFVLAQLQVTAPPR